MRITEGTIATNFLFTLNKSRERIVELQSQLASGKKIQNASDDPQVADTVLRLNELKSAREQYKKNALEGQELADTTADILSQFADMMTSVKEVLVRASGTKNESDLATLSERVNQLLSEGVDIANTKFNGKFIFGGTQSLDLPYTLAPDGSAVTKNPKGIDGVIKYQIGDSIAHQANISGEQGLKGTQYFDLLIQIRDAMKSGSFDASVYSPQVDQSISNILDTASYAASYANHFDAVRQNLDSQQSQIVQYLSITQDTDVAQAVMQLKQEETMLDAALNTGGRIIPKSLLDYLR